jgi:hypothetical protein
LLKHPHSEFFAKNSDLSVNPIKGNTNGNLYKRNSPGAFGRWSVQPNSEQRNL